MAAKFIVTFHSVYWAMQAEQTLQAAGFTCRLRPVPRQFSSSCGVCAEVAAADLRQVLAALTAANLEHESAHGPLA